MVICDTFDSLTDRLWTRPQEENLIKLVAIQSGFEDKLLQAKSERVN